MPRRGRRRAPAGRATFRRLLGHALVWVGLCWAPRLDAAPVAQVESGALAATARPTVVDRADACQYTGGVNASAVRARVVAAARARFVTVPVVVAAAARVGCLERRPSAEACVRTGACASYTVAVYRLEVDTVELETDEPPDTRRVPWGTPARAVVHVAVRTDDGTVETASRSSSEPFHRLVVDLHAGRRDPVFPVGRPCTLAPHVLLRYRVVEVDHALYDVDVPGFPCFNRVPEYWDRQVGPDDCWLPGSSDEPAAEDDTRAGLRRALADAFRSDCPDHLPSVQRAILVGCEVAVQATRYARRSLWYNITVDCLRATAAGRDSLVRLDVVPVPETSAWRAVHVLAPASPPPAAAVAAALARPRRPDPIYGERRCTVEPEPTTEFDACRLFGARIAVYRVVWPETRATAACNGRVVLPCPPDERLDSGRRSFDGQAAGFRLVLPAPATVMQAVLDLHGAPDQLPGGALVPLHVWDEPGDAPGAVAVVLRVLVLQPDGRDPLLQHRRYALALATDPGADDPGVLSATGGPGWRLQSAYELVGPGANDAPRGWSGQDCVPGQVTWTDCPVLPCDQQPTTTRRFAVLTARAVGVNGGEMCSLVPLTNETCPLPSACAVHRTVEPVPYTAPYEERQPDTAVNIVVAGGVVAAVGVFVLIGLTLLLATGRRHRGRSAMAPNEHADPSVGGPPPVSTVSPTALRQRGRLPSKPKAKTAGAPPPTGLGTASLRPPPALSSAPSPLPSPSAEQEPDPPVVVGPVPPTLPATNLLVVRPGENTSLAFVAAAMGIV
jgi:hypothetical protein